jgi:hypothetical protein
VRTHPSLKFIAVVIVCGLSASCDDLKPLSDNPLTPTPPTLVTLELTGPTTFAPGESVAFTLMARVTNGKDTDVTSTSQWNSTNPSVLTSQGPGRYRANTAGDSQISVNYGRLNASREVIVVPTGTFRVTGRVTESDGPFPISGARVQARDSSGNGPSTESDGSGFFRLFGVAPDSEIVVSRAGYSENTRHVTIDKHSTVNFEMILNGPRPRVDGTYTVTLDLSGCRDGFRPEYAHRVYTAVVQQSGSSVEVRFTEPSFAVNSANLGNLMQGRVEGTGLFLYAQSFYYYYYGPSSYPFLVEALPDESRLVLTANVTLAESGESSYTGKLNGYASNYGPRFPNDKYLGGCDGGQLTFTRR